MLSTFSPPLLPVLPLTVKALIALGAIASFHEAAVPYIFIDYKNTYWKANATAYLAILLLPLSFWSQIGVLCLPMLLHYYRVVHKPQKNWRKNFSIKKTPLLSHPL